MPITHIYQGHRGCFVACVAMIMNIDYVQAFELIHPKLSQKKYTIWQLGKNKYRLPAIKTDLDASLTPRQAFKRLVKLGLKPRFSEIRDIKKLKRTAIIWIRWENEPEIMHSIVFDSETKLFWDPLLPAPLSSFGKENLQRQLDSVIYLDNL